MRVELSLRALAVGVVVAAVVLVAGGVAIASQLSPSVTSVTGCLSLSGDLVKFAVGDEPLKPCSGNQTQVHLTGNDLASVVTAGTGLVGESADGVTTLSVDPAYALPQGCQVNQVARWNGSRWVCGDAVGPLP